jgi:predicted 5'-methylthioadenosine/S-adenosylhomocysteine nucleosidase
MRGVRCMLDRLLLSYSSRNLRPGCGKQVGSRTPVLDLPAEPDLPLRIPGVPEARLSTGGNIISGRAYATIAADMADMETYALLRACQSYKLPLIGLRGISDGAGELQHLSGWTEYLHVIDRKLSHALDGLFTALEEGLSISGARLRSPAARAVTIRRQARMSARSRTSPARTLRK